YIRVKVKYVYPEYVWSFSTCCRCFQLCEVIFVWCQLNFNSYIVMLFFISFSHLLHRRSLILIPDTKYDFCFSVSTFTITAATSKEAGAENSCQTNSRNFFEVLFHNNTLLFFFSFRQFLAYMKWCPIYISNINFLMYPDPLQHHRVIWIVLLQAHSSDFLQTALQL